MRLPSILLLALSLATATGQAKPLFGGPKTIPLDASGIISGEIVSAPMGQGGYVSGATKIVVPLVSVAFETHAKASVTRSSGGGASIKSKSLETHLIIDDKVLQNIADQMQAIVEKDLTAQGFELLPNTAVDRESRIIGITKDGKVGEEIGDNFMSGFGGNGTYNRWFTAGNRPLFGTGAQGPLSETSALIRTARETGKTLLLYRFKVQYTEIDAKNNVFFSDVKGKNLLHIVSADLSVFTPAHTQGSIIKLNADITAGADYVQEVRELPADQSQWKALNLGAAFDSLINGSVNTTSKGKASGHYAIVANADRYQADSTALLKAVSRQFAQALRSAQK
jgi:hypothetical protein